MNRERWATLKSLFETVLELEGPERDDFLADLAEADSDLHAELLALLAADATEDSAVDRDPGQLLDGLDEAVEVEGGVTDRGDTDAHLGSRIGPWRVDARIGEGGMGVVYRARRADGAFDQSVALKVLRRGMDTEGILARFRSERQILASLEHPNIARLVDGGMTDAGLPWFTLEYVQGRHLTAYCDEQRLSVDARLRLFETVCAAVQYAQERLVVHRDLKPSNVLVADDGTVKLLDFGIARVLSESGADATGITTVVGAPRALTLAYAAPEQIEGGTITTATDVYALGTILYELLTGRRPFAGDTPIDVLKNVVEAVFLPPRGLVSSVPRALEAICLRAMEVEPDRRYATAAELADDLERYLADLP
ncbi:MAG: serine/threonine protein kinase, partial [Gemmatimonadetes bacterium]|nr:serine/threonine protein kinase [Gemmatimonadota bacterium]